MVFLDQSLTRWGGWWRWLTNRPLPLRDKQRIARFLASDGHFRRSNLEVKRQAFMPPVDLELSVAHIDGLVEPDVWKLGKRLIGSGRPIYGRADLDAADYIGVRLRVLRDDKPYRHAKAVNWPDIDDKAAQIEIAQELASLANIKSQVYFTDQQSRK